MVAVQQSGCVVLQSAYGAEEHEDVLQQEVHCCLYAVSRGEPGWQELMKIQRILPFKPVYGEVLNLTSAGLEWELCVPHTKPRNIWLSCSSGFSAIALSVYLYHGVVTSVRFPYVLLGCLVAKEGTEKKIPQALILNCCNIK